MGVPPNGWFISGKILLIWMRTGGKPMTQETPISKHGDRLGNLGIYPLVNSWQTGKSPLLMGKSSVSIHLSCSMAMVNQRVSRVSYHVMGI